MTKEALLAQMPNLLRIEVGQAPKDEEIIKGRMGNLDLYSLLVSGQAPDLYNSSISAFWKADKVNQKLRHLPEVST